MKTKLFVIAALFAVVSAQGRGGGGDGATPCPLPRTPAGGVLGPAMVLNERSFIGVYAGCEMDNECPLISTMDPPPPRFTQIAFRAPWY